MANLMSNVFAVNAYPYFLRSLLLGAFLLREPIRFLERCEDEGQDYKLYPNDGDHPTEDSSLFESRSLAKDEMKYPVHVAVVGCRKCCHGYNHHSNRKQYQPP